MSTPEVIDIHIGTRQDFVTPMEEHADHKLATRDRYGLALAIQERGYEVTFSRSKTSYDLDAGLVDVLHPRFVETENGIEAYATPERIALDGIKAIRNTIPSIRGGVPELNHPLVRGTAYDKSRANALLNTVGLAKQYADLLVGGDLGDAFDQIDSDRVVIKPTKSHQSNGLYIGTKAEIARLHAEGLLPAKDMIVEEYLNYRLPMPVHGYDAAQQEIIDAANARGAAKELRTYIFGRDAEGLPRTSYTMRIAAIGDTAVRSGTDWTFIDRDSVPEEFIEQADTVLTAMEQHTGVKEVHVALDSVVAEMPDGERSILPMEMNASEPQLVFPEEQPEIAREQAGMMADQLVRVARRGGTK